MKTRTLLLAMFVTGLALGQGPPPSRVGVMPMGLDLVHAGSMCLVLSANAESGTFFANLTVREKHGQHIFRVGSKEVKFFPGHVLVKLDGVVHRCAPKEKGRYLNDLRIDDDFMTSLQFKTYWKNGFDLRTVDAKIEKQGRIVDPDLARISPSADVWEYELSIASEDVPLSDSLVLLVVDGNGAELSRMSGRPGAR